MVGVNATAAKLAPRKRFCCLAIKMSVIGWSQQQRHNYLAPPQATYGSLLIRHWPEAGTNPKISDRPSTRDPSSTSTRSPNAYFDIVTIMSDVKSDRLPGLAITSGLRRIGLAPYLLPPPKPSANNTTVVKVISEIKDESKAVAYSPCRRRSALRT